MRNLLFILTTIVCFTTFNCDTSYFDKEIEEFEWNGNFTGPLGHYTIDVNDIIDQFSDTNITSVVTYDENGLITLNYSDNLELKADFNFQNEIPPLEVSETINSPINGSPIFNFSNSIVLDNSNINLIDGLNTSQQGSFSEVIDFNGNEIHEIEFNSINMEIEIQSNIDTNLDIELKSHSFVSKTDSSILTENISVSGRETKTVTIPLENYNADLTYLNGNYNETFNNILLEYLIGFDYTVGDQITNTDSITFSIKLKDIEGKVIYGKFQNQTGDLYAKENIKLNFFNELNITSLEILKPKLTFNLTNDLGIPFKFDFNNSIFSNSNGDSQILNFSEGNFINISPATYNSDQGKVESTINSINLDNESSNIKDILNIIPKEIDFNALAEIVENTSDDIHFYAFDNKGISGDFNLEMPLALKLKGLKIEEEAEFSVGLSEEDAEDFSNVDLHLNVLTDFPFDIKVKLDFEDENGNIINKNILLNDNDEIVEQNQIDLIQGSTNYDKNGKTIEPNNNKILLRLKNEDFEDILKISKIKMTLEFDTSGEEPVKLFKDYILKLNINTAVNYTYSDNE